MTSNFLKKTLRGAGFMAIVGMGVMLSGCLDNDDANSNAVPVGYVSLYNAIPDAPGLDIAVDERRINTGTFDYSGYSGYLNFYTGQRNIKFLSANAANALADTTLKVDAGHVYSVFVINRLSNAETLVVEDSTNAVADGKAMIRFIQLSPDAPAVDVEYASDAETAWVDDFNFKEVSSFHEVSAATYSFKVKNADTEAVLLSADNVKLLPGRYYTIITRGFATPPSGNSNLLSIEVL